MPGYCITICYLCSITSDQYNWHTYNIYCDLNINFFPIFSCYSRCLVLVKYEMAKFWQYLQLNKIVLSSKLKKINIFQIKTKTLSILVNLKLCCVKNLNIFSIKIFYQKSNRTNSCTYIYEPFKSTTTFNHVM